MPVAENSQSYYFPKLFRIGVGIPAYLFGWIGWGAGVCQAFDKRSIQMLHDFRVNTELTDCLANTLDSHSMGKNLFLGCALIIAATTVCTVKLPNSKPMI